MAYLIHFVIVLLSINFDLKHVILIIKSCGRGQVVESSYLWAEQTKLSGYPAKCDPL